MERSWLFILVASAALLEKLVGAEATWSSGSGGDDWKWNAPNHVGGKVICQDCTKDWKSWSYGRPMRGAKVAVTCMDWRWKETYSCDTFTDWNGWFDLPVNRYGRDGSEIRPEEHCFVRLVWSPDHDCDIVTDYGGGKNGARPYRSGAGDGSWCSAGPFYFTSRMCQSPDPWIP